MTANEWLNECLGSEIKKLINRGEVICYRCLKVYRIREAPKTKTKRLRIKESCCPMCECKIYMG